MNTDKFGHADYFGAAQAEFWMRFLFLLLLFSFAIFIDQGVLSVLTRCNGNLGAQLDPNLAVAHVRNVKLNSSLDNLNRLAIIVLFKYETTDQEKISSLFCSIRSLIFSMSRTPIDVYLFSTSKFFVEHQHWVQELNVTMVPMQLEDMWCIPKGLIDPSKWAWRQFFPIDYYLMGQWRLLFVPNFVRSMGYRYYLQADHDVQLSQHLPYNLLELMATNGHQMAGSSELVHDYQEVLDGLAELTRFWLQISKFTPVSSFYRHFNSNENSFRNLDSENWDREISPGYFQVVDLRLWFSESVQDFLRTVLRSGRDIEGRWSEQGVFNMVRQLFVEDSAFLQVEGVRHPATTCEQSVVTMDGTIEQQSF